MRMWDPRFDEARAGGSPPPGGPSGGGLEALRRTGETFLRAADDALDRALSADSTQFLEANRQCGGQ